MTIFARDFEIEQLSGPVLEENRWLGDLLLFWYPAGDAIGRYEDLDDSEHLRLAIRDGYLNFYRAGQSVAKVSFDHQGKLRAKIHNKYVYGTGGSGQSYVTTSAAYPEELGSEQLVSYDGATSLRKWILEANKHGGKEKHFVDLIVGHNPNVIDLEMGLPFHRKNSKSGPPPDGEKAKRPSAPRMDLVAIEPVGNRWQVVFWEVKLVNDGRARCRGEDEPDVIRQINDYTLWLECEDDVEFVARAYKRTCDLLTKLHEVAKRFRPDIEELGIGIRAVAADYELPLINKKPRLLIDAREKNVFTKNGHLRKLLKLGMYVQMVENPDQMTLEVPG